MTPDLAAQRRANLRGSIWMVTAMALFAVEDTFLKSAAVTLPVGQVLVLFGLGGALVFALLGALRGEALFVADVLSRPMRIRVVFEIAGRLFYTLAITLTPLSAATVILQATPLVVVAGAAIVFGETVGWRRWTAIGLGMCGVLFIVQPGAESFSPLSVLAIVGMLGFAGRDLASRAAPAALATSTLGFYGFAAIVAAGALFLAWQPTPFAPLDAGSAAKVAAAVLAGTLAYGLLMKAMRTGEVSAVTPFRYTRLLFGIALGVLFFGESLGLSMMIGSALIIASGLFILSRGRRRAALA